MNDNNQIIMYRTEDGLTKIDVTLENETVWLTQDQMAELFQRDRSVITKHVGNIFKEGELDEKSNVQFLHIANSDKPVKYYSLVLQNAGTISHEMALAKAGEEYSKYKKQNIGELSQVEKDFIESAKKVQKMLESKKN